MNYNKQDNSTNNLLYEEGNDWWSTKRLKRNRCRVIYRSICGLFGDVIVQEEFKHGWVDLPAENAASIEVMKDAVYFAAMSFMAGDLVKERKLSGLPAIEGYNLGP